MSRERVHVLREGSFLEGGFMSRGRVHVLREGSFLEGGFMSSTNIVLTYSLVRNPNIHTHPHMVRNQESFVLTCSARSK